MPLVDLTRFLAFHLTDDESEARSCLFSTGLCSMEVCPRSGTAAILRWVIDSKDAFFRYLRLLLSELGDPFAAALAAQSSSAQARGAWRGDDVPFLEEMVRAFCRAAISCDAIERLIARLDDWRGREEIPCRRSSASFGTPSGSP